MPDGPSRALRRGRVAALLPRVTRLAPALLSVGLLAAGCGFGEPRTAPPSGVDGLVVPTPGPDPADFVGGVDNPWFPLAPGSRWTYEVPGAGTVVVSVSGTTLVAGVEATAVETVERGTGGRPGAGSTEWYAQDRDGNVWRLGEEGTWEAGESGAEAGLVMPATPRVGDGFVQEHAPGVAEDERRVLSIEAQRSTSYGVFDALVQVEDSSPLEPGVTSEAFYARGVGLVAREGQTGDLELVDFTTG